MGTVELRTAYAWDCGRCGRENFVRAVIHEFSPEEEAELKQERGIEESATGNWVTVPGEVTCTSCGSRFSTRHFREDE